MDVDGTLTDGKLYIGHDGEMFKAFDVKDGCGIKDILPTLGMIPVVITARNSRILEHRCKELNVSYLLQGVREKRKKLDEIISDLNEKENACYSFENVAYIGDDILDLQCMVPIKDMGGIVGCPRDAALEVIEVADFVSAKNGGNGAVREFIEYLKKHASTLE